jgi:transaldolase
VTKLHQLHDEQGHTAWLDDTMDRLAAVGVDMDDVGRALEAQGVRRFQESFTHVLATLDVKARDLARR